MDAAAVSSAMLLLTSRHAGFRAKTQPLHSERTREDFVRLKSPSALSLVSGWEVVLFSMFLDRIDCTTSTNFFTVLAGRRFHRCRVVGHSPSTGRLVNKDRRSSPGGAGATNCDVLMSGHGLGWGKNVQKASVSE